MFVQGERLKAALATRTKAYLEMPEEDKEKGLFVLPRGPARDSVDAIAEIWDRLIPGWRSREVRERNVEPRAAQPLVDHVRKFVAAADVQAEKLDFDPAEPDSISIERMIAQRKGSFWQLPKDMKR